MYHYFPINDFTASNTSDNDISCLSTPFWFNTYINAPKPMANNMTRKYLTPGFNLELII